MGDPGGGEGQDISGLGHRVVRGLERLEEHLAEDPLGPHNVRRFALLACLVAVVTSSGTASGTPEQTPRSIVERALDRVRQGHPILPERTREGAARSRVIVTLEDPPLATAAFARRFAGFGFGPRRKLNVSSPFSSTYLARLDAAQERAIAAVRAEIPEAVVSRRYKILLNGFTVSVPYHRLPKLLGLDVAEHVYPNLSYRPSLNTGPAVIGATQFSRLTGALGTGVKVAVVDDGVDHEHPFLSPAGLSYPAGFPKGPGGSTTPKVIVARGFAGPGASSAPLDREQSFHGTHVAGIIAGVPTDVPAGRPGFCVEAQGGCHPAVKGLAGVAPRAYIGNYRVFNVPFPARRMLLGDTAEIVAAFEAAVSDGMDVINFSGGGAQADPRTDAMMAAVRNVVRAGVVPIISAGNDRDFFGLGTAGSPATSPDAISVGAVANGHVFGESHLRRLTGRPRADRLRADPAHPARPGLRPTSGSSTSAPSAAPAACSAATGRRSRPGRSGVRSRSSAGADARTRRRPHAPGLRARSESSSRRTARAIRRSP